MYKAPYAIIRIPNTSGDRIIKIVPGTNSIEVNGTNSVLIHSTEVINGTTIYQQMIYLFWIVVKSSIAIMN